MSEDSFEEKREHIIADATSRAKETRYRRMLLASVVVITLLMLVAGGALTYAYIVARDQARNATGVAEELTQVCATPVQNRTDRIEQLCDNAKKVVEEAPASIQGAQGPPGIQGPPGPQGVPGADGIDGEDGTDGRRGEQGVAGSNGANGADGADGQDGAQGVPGEQGPQGDPGPAGQQGPQGVAGPQGPPGPQGPAGPNCPDGYRGEQLEVVTPQGGTETIFACVPSEGASTTG